MSSGIAIAALGGDCPLHALVSRGVAPLSPAYKVERLSEVGSGFGIRTVRVHNRRRRRRRRRHHNRHDDDDDDDDDDGGDDEDNDSGGN